MILTNLKHVFVTQILITARKWMTKSIAFSRIVRWLLVYKVDLVTNLAFPNIVAELVLIQEWLGLTVNH